MLNRFFTLFILLLIGLSTHLYGQSSKDLEEVAYYYFSNNDYKKAYELYDKLNAKKPKEIDYKFKLGYCCLYYAEKKKRAIDIFEDLKKNGSKDIELDIDYYLGKAYHVNYRFSDAIKSLEAYLALVNKKPKEDDKLFIEDAKKVINNCNSGIKLIDKQVKADIINIGAPITEAL